MHRDKINSLDNTITKRLGKKANRIWYEAKRELEVIEIIKNHINRVVRFKPQTNVLEKPYNKTFMVYYDYYREKADEETMEQIILWLKENIDKERLKEWLENE